MTSILPNTRRPDVTFHVNGRIDITARVAKLLQLQRGDVIGVAMDNGEYLLHVHVRADERIGKHEGHVYPTNRGKRHTNNFRAYSPRICRAILRAAGATDIARLSVGIPMNINGETAIPIIYKYNLAQ